MASFDPETWPRDSKSYQSQAFLCTADQPMPEDARRIGRWSHSDVHEVGEQEDGWPAGDIVTYECINCKHRWKSELPQ